MNTFWKFSLALSTRAFERLKQTYGIFLKPGKGFFQDFVCLFVCLNIPYELITLGLKDFYKLLLLHYMYLYLLYICHISLA